MSWTEWVQPICNGIAIGGLVFAWTRVREARRREKEAAMYIIEHGLESQPPFECICGSGDARWHCPACGH